MSTSVDERVVQMQFDNKQFETGVKESLSSIDKLKKGLDLSEASKNLTGLNDTAKKFNLAGIESNIDRVADKFSLMTIAGVTAFVNLTNSAVEAGKKITKALTIDPISGGYKDYEEKLTSVQTIMNATGMDEQKVQGFFSELDTYADKTIYNLKDMTSAYAKFTNAGVDSEKSIPAIKGIANMTALAGQGSQAAAIAMYNLSQSIAGGFLTTIDYKSLNLANVATIEWKKQMADAAVKAGTLKKTNSGLYLLPGAKEAVTMQALFNDELSKGWASTSVLLKVLGDYGNENTAIGKKAQDAAQIVKSWGMMMETISASVGTTWTDTFQILIGDLEESKKLFTSLTNFVSEFVNVTADARNGMLQMWKDLGGRDMLIEAIVKAVKLFGDVLKPVQNAFTKVFPPVTGKILADATKNLLDFIKSLKVTPGVASSIEKTFTGLFSVLKFGGQLFWTVTKAVFGFTKYLGKPAAIILEFTGYIGDLLTKLTLSKNVGKALEFIFNGLGAAISNAFENIKFIFQQLKALFGSFGGVDLSPLEDFAANIKAQLLSIGGIKGLLEKVFGGFGTIDLSGVDTFTSDLKTKFKPLDSLKVAFEKVLEIGNLILDKAKVAFGHIKKILGDTFTGTNLMSVITIINSGLFANILLNIGKLIKSLTNISDNVGGFIGKVTGVLDAVKESLKAWQNDLKAGMLLKIASAIAILAIALIALSFVDPKKLATAMKAITVLFADLLGAMAIFSKIESTPGYKAMGRVMLGFLGLSIAMVIMAKAVKELSGMDWDGLAIGLLGFTGIITIIIGASKALMNTKANLIEGSTGLILFSIAVLILSEAVKRLGEMDPQAMAVGLTAVGGIILALAAFTKYADSSSNLLVMGTSLILVATSVLILVQAIKAMSAIPLEAFSMGLTMIGLSLATLVLALNYMTGTIAGAAALLVVIASLLLLAGVIKIFAAIPLEQFVLSLTMIGLSLTALVVALNAMTGTIAGALALAIVSVSLIGLAIALGMLSLIPITGLGIALLALVGVFLVLALASAAAIPIALLAVSLLALSVSFWLIVASLGGLALGIVAIGGGLVLLSTGLMAIASVMTMAAPSLLLLVAAMLPLLLLSPLILALGAALVVLSLGLILMGVGISMMSTGLNVLSMVAPRALILLKQFADMSVQMTKYSLSIMAVGVALAVFGIGATVAGIGLLAVGLGLMLFSYSMKMFQQIDFTAFDGVVEFAADLLIASAGLGLSAPGLIKGGKALITYGEGALKSAEGIKAIEVGITGFMKTMKEVPVSIQTNGVLIIKSVSELMALITSQIELSKIKLLATVNAIMTTVLASVNGQRVYFINAGINLVDGFIEGIQSRVDAAAKAAAEMAAMALKAANKELIVKSPSKAFAKTGMYADMGLAKGLTKYSYIAEDAASNMARKTLTPVVDMTKSMNFAPKGFINSSSSAPTIAREFQNGRQSSLDSSNINSGTSVSFVQNNYSPTALSRLDIYRQTKNQISALKGALDGV